MSDHKILLVATSLPKHFFYFWSPNGHCLVHNSPSLNRVLVQFNPLIVRVSQNVLFIDAFGN
jgi:hypothetical protein